MPKKIVVITLFPEMFNGVLGESILKRAIERDLIEVKFVNLRNFGIGPRKQVDDTPYGGGAGMVLRVDVMEAALNSAKEIAGKSKVILLTPQGDRLKQAKLGELAAKEESIIIICGHYEGFDERIRTLVDEEVSVGDFVLTGGEIPAMVLIDGISRLITGVLGSEESHQDESHSEEGRIEYPHYTRPEVWEKESVPPVLLSGNHAEIAKCRQERSEERSAKGPTTSS